MLFKFCHVGKDSFYLILKIKDSNIKDDFKDSFDFRNKTIFNEDFLVFIGHIF